MIKIKIIPMGNIRKIVGWNTKEIEIEDGKIENILKNIKIDDRSSLFDLLIDKDGIKKKYSILLNGKTVSSKDLNKELKSDDNIFVMDILPIIAGGINE